MCAWQLSRDICDVTFQQLVGGTWTDVSEAQSAFYCGYSPKNYDRPSGETHYTIVAKAAKSSSLSGSTRYFSNDRVILRYKNILQDADGNYHDCILTVHDVYFNNYSHTNDRKFLVFETWGLQGTSHKSDTHFTVDVQVSDATENEAIYIMFSDIDVTEGCKEGVSLISGLYPGSSPVVAKNYDMKINDGYSYTATMGSTSTDEDSYKCAVAWCAKANFSQFYWQGRDCSTTIGLRSAVEIPTTPITYFNVSTETRYEDANGTLTSYAQRNTQQFQTGTTGNYSFTYSTLGTDSGVGADVSWVFKSPTSSTVSGQHTSDYTYYLTYERNRYTYKFHKNPPAGVPESSITNMPSDQTVVADPTHKSNTVGSPKLRGYVFLGWNTKPDGTGSTYTAGEVMKSNKDFYAQWRPIYYYVVYHSNTPSDDQWTTGKKHHFDTTYKYKGVTDPWIPVATEVQVDGKFYKHGYHIKRWVFTDGTRKEYYYVDPEHPVGTDSIQDWFKNLTDVDGATVHIYAEWTPNPYYLRLHENFQDQQYGDYKDKLLYYDENYQLPKPPPWQHNALVYGYDIDPDVTVGAKWRCGEYVRNLTDLYGLADDRTKPIINLYTIWDCPPIITLKSDEVHLSSDYAASLALSASNGTVSDSDLEAVLMSYVDKCWDYEWEFRYKTKKIPVGINNGYVFKIAALEPATVRDNAKSKDADTYYVTFQVTDDAHQSATAVLTLFVGNKDVDIMVR